jgi:hypothetical protein
MKEYEIKCTHCGRFLGATDTTFIGKLKCSNSSCKKMVNIKVVTPNSTDEDLRYTFPKEEENGNE